MTENLLTGTLKHNTKLNSLFCLGGMMVMPDWGTTEKTITTEIEVNMEQTSNQVFLLFWPTQQWWLRQNHPYMHVLILVVYSGIVI